MDLFTFHNELSTIVINTVFIVIAPCTTYILIEMISNIYSQKNIEAPNKRDVCCVSTYKTTITKQSSLSCNHCRTDLSPAFFMEPDETSKKVH